MLTTQCHNQTDPRWSGLKLSKDGLRTIGSDGCALTCLSDVLGLTPDFVLAELRKVGGIADTGDLNWTGVPRAFPKLRFNFRWGTVNEDRNSAYRKTVPAALQSIRNLLALGQPVIVRTNHPSGVTHFVTVVDTNPNDTDLWVNDPDGGRQILYSVKYGDPTKNLLAYVVLIGDPKEGATVSETTKLNLISHSAQSLWKAQQMKEGFGTQTYAKEIIDTLIG